MRAVLHLFRQLVSLLLLVLLMLGFVGVIFLDSQPVVSQQGDINAAAVQQGKQWFNQLNSSIAHADAKPILLQANTSDINAAFALASRSLPGFRGVAQQQGSVLTTLMSLPLQLPLLNRTFYLNAQILLSGNEQNVRIEQIQLGSLSLPGSTALGLLEWTANRIWGPGKGTELLATVRSASFHATGVEVELQPPAGWTMERVKQSGLAFYREVSGSNALAPLVELYYQHALQIAQQHRDSQSLTVYLQAMFQLAAQRTAAQDAAQGLHQATGVDAVATTPTVTGYAQQENKAALLALARLLGGRHLQLLVIGRSDDQRKPPRVTLARRPDLQQHFIYSAALQLMANQMLSDTVGQAKELLDSIKGGSGFSFVDLLADRAGIKFAHIATASDASARAMQQFWLQPRTEKELFPSKQHLPEGISQRDFETTYTGIESQAFRQIVADIDARLMALPLYQLADIESSR